MHMLKDLLQGVEVRSVVGDKTVQVTDIEFDSRKVKSGSLFSLHAEPRLMDMPIFRLLSQLVLWRWCAKSCQQSDLKVSLSYR